MKPMQRQISEIAECGCYYMGIGNGCIGCPFEQAMENYGEGSCSKLRNNYHGLVLKIASNAYRTNKKFAKVFDTRCPHLRCFLNVKAVIV